jgi:hypothetical protein
MKTTKSPWTSWVFKRQRETKDQVRSWRPIRDDERTAFDECSAPRNGRLRLFHAKRIPPCILKYLIVLVFAGALSKSVREIIREARQTPPNLACSLARYSKVRAVNRLAAVQVQLTLLPDRDACRLARSAAASWSDLLVAMRTCCATHERQHGQRCARGVATICGVPNARPHGVNDNGTARIPMLTTFHPQPCLGVESISFAWGGEEGQK